MNKCHYFLSNGLWKIVEKYFDSDNKLQNDYFWCMAVHPNHASFGNHIISTPWQQSWMTMNILQQNQQYLDESENGSNLSDNNIISVLRKEVDFQFILRNYTNDAFVLQLFNIYSKIQTHLLVNYGEAEIRSFNFKLKTLFKSLLKECPSTAHTLLLQMLQHGFFVTSCESLLYEVEDDEMLCGLVVSCLCEIETIQFHLSFVVGLLQTEFRYNLCLLLLATENISFLQSMIDEDKKSFSINSRQRLQSLMDKGMEPISLFANMTLMGRHFLLQIMDVINAHLDEFDVVSECANIPSFIWPLILLQNWNNSSVSDELLLKLIEKCKESTKDKTIIQITYILEWYKNFVKWYQKHETADNKISEAENKEILLKKAKDHSVLYLINNTTDLSATDWCQIRELLNQGKSKPTDQKTWDLVLFDGYCIMMLVFQAIVISTEIFHVAKSQKVKLGDIFVLNEAFHCLYLDEVTDKLKKVKEMLKTLYPCAFRLEILENIFASIFVTYEDVRKLNYYANTSINYEKYIEKAQLRYKSSTGKLEKNFSFVGITVPQSADKTEESNTAKKNKMKGFFCKKYIVRDLIYLVKECLDNLEEDSGKQSDETKLEVLCSIKSSQMENRLDRLLESVSEATWRLQLVTDPTFISEIGAMRFACGQDPNHHFDGDWMYSSNEINRVGLFKSRKKSLEKPNESGSHSNSSPNGNSNGEPSAFKHHKTPGPAIMNQMLASDSSLVVQCLSRGDVLNADHIIQMMSTEENRQNLEGELNLTRAISDLKKKLQSISTESPVRKAEVDSTTYSDLKPRSLQSIQMIANQGVNSTALTNHVERFLSSCILPSIQINTSCKVAGGSVFQCIENAVAILTIDLAPTIAKTFQDFKDLLNIASKDCPELSTRIQSPISAQTTSTKPLGYIVFTQNMIALLQEINRSREDNEAEISLQQFLSSHRYPFSLKSLKDNINFWKNLSLAFSDFEKNFEESKSLVSCEEDVLDKCQKNIKDMQNVFDSVTKLSENCGEFMDLGKSDAPGGEMSKSVNYCDLLSRYLSDLSVFILENVSSKKEELPEPITLHSLLEESAVDIIDKLIFEYKIEPGVLEKKAQQLGFNLSASLIAGCCPRLPQMLSPAENSKCPPADRIVLNELVPDYKSLSTPDPNKVVESILSELLIAFRTYSHNQLGDGNIAEKNLLNEKDIFELKNDMKVQKILEKTLEINFVDLRSLNETSKLAFFTNLLNLMVCHCYLSSKIEVGDGIFSKHAFFRDIGFAFSGYNIGELGFVSIMDVRRILLGAGLFARFSPTLKEEWSFLDLASDPRLLFVTTNFRLSSPPLLLVTCDKFGTVINEAIGNYIDAYVSVIDGQIYITDILEWYLNKEVISECTEEVEVGENDSSHKMECILNYLIEHSSRELQDQLKTLSSSGTVVTTISDHNEIVLRLDYNLVQLPLQPPEKYTEKWIHRTLSDPILRHLSQSSRVLADIAQKIHEAKEPVQTEMARDVLTEEKLKYLDLLFGAPWLQHAAPLFRNNTVITALSKYPQEEQLVEFFEDCVSKCEWNKCLDVLFALPDYFIFSDLNVKRFKDMALREASELALEGGGQTSWYYCEHISDVNMRIETVIKCCKRWPGPVSCTQLSSILRDNPFLTVKLRDYIKCLVKKIRVYNTILEVSPELEAKTWFDVCTIAENSPDVVVKSLIKNNQLELCLQWISLPGVLDSVQSFIDADFVLPFFDHLFQEVDLIHRLVNSLPSSKLIEIYDQLIFQLTSVPSIAHLVQRALRLDPSPRYRLVEISLKCLNQLDQEEQSHLVHLISSPLLMIEQLLMNMKLDALERILKKVREIADDDIINQDEINKLIVSYATKAVEFNLVKTEKNSDTKQSFLLDESNQSIAEPVVPPDVPEKSQWVPDNMVSLCMCCHLVSFSMFNRRHHCRRCGKVVCGSCSTHRLKVAGYRGVAVRVCQNCYLHQSKTDADAKCSQSTDTIDSSQITQDTQYCKLSTDASRNATIRDEFSYENSPNVTLCLGIFNLLPNTSYLRVLLEESEKMLKMIQSNGKSGNPEVDFGVVVQIIRSLIVGAKVKYAHAGSTTDVDWCDALLSQVDILQLLINNHCSRLIPSEPLSGVTLRYLRDKLVEEELWELAMEISTKCGLDRNGVWAAWGKVCLAAGSWQEARSKFAHCLTSSPKPTRNPPLLDEICRILESPTSYVSVKSTQKASEKGVEAQEVAQVLSTLKFISQGKYPPPTVTSAKNSVQYEEEVFYLTTYGSHQALLSFYLKYDELKTAFSYLLQRKLDPDTFVDCLLLPSYRLDEHEKFKSTMLSVDQTLESFKKYLAHSCVSLQKAGYLFTLFDIQILMQDYVRAAVTCTHLYKKNASNFTALVSRSNYLHMALRHLEEELVVMNKKTKRLDCIMKLDAKKINRHMNTIWRQLEAAKFLASCEENDKFTVKDIFPNEVVNEDEIPTLFDGNAERRVLVKMIVLLGKNISEGFGIAFRIIQDHQLDFQSIFVEIGKKLSEEARLNDIRSLVDCLKTSGAANVNWIVDKIISASIPILVQNGAPLSELELFSKLVKNVDLRISALIDTRQLVSACILAVKYNRLNDVQRILEVADQQGLTIIKKICLSKLNQSNESESSDDRASPVSHSDE